MGDMHLRAEGLICPCPNGAAFRKILMDKSMSWFGENYEVAKLVKKNMPLFIFVYDAKLLWGIYKALDCAKITSDSDDCMVQSATVPFEVGYKCHPLPDTVLKSIQELQYTSDGTMNLVLFDTPLSILWQAFSPIEDSSGEPSVDYEGQVPYGTAKSSQRAPDYSTHPYNGSGCLVNTMQYSPQRKYGEYLQPSYSGQCSTPPRSPLYDQDICWSGSEEWRNPQASQNCFREVPQDRVQKGGSYYKHGLYLQESQVQTDKELYEEYILDSQTEVTTLETRLERIVSRIHDARKGLAYLSIEKNDLCKKTEQQEYLIADNSGELKLLSDLFPEPIPAQQQEQQEEEEEKEDIPRENFTAQSNQKDRFEDVPWRERSPTPQHELVSGTHTEPASARVEPNVSEIKSAADNPLLSTLHSPHTDYSQPASVPGSCKGADHHPDFQDGSGQGLYEVNRVVQGHVESMPAPNHAYQNHPQLPKNPDLSREHDSGDNLPRPPEVKQAAPPAYTSPSQWSASQEQTGHEQMHTVYSPHQRQPWTQSNQVSTWRTYNNDSRSDIQQCQPNQENQQLIPLPGKHSPRPLSAPLSPVNRSSPNLVVQQIQGMQQNQGNPPNLPNLPSVHSISSFQQLSPRGVNGYQSLNMSGYASKMGSQGLQSPGSSPLEYPSHPPQGSQSHALLDANTTAVVPQAQGDMYMLGGSVNYENLHLVEKYLDNRLWQSVGSIPEGLVPIAGDACSIGKSIYVFGLETEPRAENFYKRGAVHRFDVTTSHWDMVTPLSTPRTSVRCVNCQDNIVVAGGQLTGTDKASNLVHVFDPHKNLWLQGPPLQQARYGMGLACIDQVVFAVGGMVDNYTPLETVEMWDIRQKNWSSIRSMDQKRGFVACTSIGEVIFALGGCSQKNIQTMTNQLQFERTVEYFETRTNKWTCYSSMADTRAFGTAENLDGYIWAIGGRRAMDSVGRMVGMEKLDLDSGQWETGLIAGAKHTRAYHMTCIIK